jgi:hypothetical protein
VNPIQEALKRKIEKEAKGKETIAMRRKHYDVGGIFDESLNVYGQA